MHTKWTTPNQLKEEYSLALFDEHANKKKTESKNPNVSLKINNIVFIKDKYIDFVITKTKNYKNFEIVVIINFLVLLLLLLLLFIS